MKIAILAGRHSTFSEIWSKYCRNNNIEHQIFNPYITNICDKLIPYEIIMFDHHQTDFTDTLFAKQLLFSLEHAGKIVFPNFKTGWHFDDKLGQKYLFESLDIQAAPSYVFYDKKEAYRWAETTSYPKVFKLRGGAGASNVMLAKDEHQAKKLIKRAFGKGFAQYRGCEYVRDKIISFKAGKYSILDLIKSFGRLIIPNEFTRKKGNERGYAYFQEFIPNDGYDIRVIQIGRKAIEIRRNARQNDFRASGSGNIIYENEKADKRPIKLTFDINKKLNTQCIAIDLVYDNKNKEYKLIEISYGFYLSGYEGVNGYWTNDLIFHKERVDLLGWIIDECIYEYKNKKIQQEKTCIQNRAKMQ